MGSNTPSSQAGAHSRHPAAHKPASDPAAEAASFNPLPTPKSPWRVVEAAPLAAFRLRVKFRDGLEGVVDMSSLIHSPGAGVFSALADPALFDMVRIEMGAPVWPGDIDIAPDAIHDAIESRDDRSCNLGAADANP